MSYPESVRKIVLVLCTASILSLAACDFGAKENPESHLAKAREFIANNELNAGMIELKNALQLESNLPEARWLLGKVYLQTGNGAAAFKELNQAQTLGYSDPELSKLLLQAMLLQGRNQDILDQTFTEDEMSDDTLLVRGNAQLGLKQYGEARKSFEEVLDRDPQSLNARKGLIRVAVSEENLDEANQLLEESLAFALEDAELWVYKGQLAFLQNDITDAEKAFAKAVLYNPDNGAAQFGLTRALLAQGKKEEALVPIKAIEDRAPNHPQAKYYRGYIALLDNDVDNAKVQLQEVITVLPKHPESLLLLSRINYDENKLAQAETYISTFLADFPSHLPALKLLSVIQLRLQQPGASIETLSNAAKQSQGDWQVLALLGSSFMENGELEKGMELLEEAADKNPNTAALRTQLAIGHLASGSIDSAISQLESAIELDPNLIRADIMLILAHLRSNESDAAITAAQALIEKQPENPLAYNLLGASFLSKKDFEKAAEQFNKAIEIRPDFTPAMANLARIELLKENQDAAESRFLEILEIDSSNADALENLAQIESRRGNTAKVLSYLEQAKEGNKNLLKPHLQLARYYLNNQNPKAALDTAREAEGLAPENPETMLVLGQALRSNRLFKESVDTLQALNELVPDSEEVLFQLALSEAQTDASGSVKSRLDRVLELNNEHVGALVARSKVAISEKKFEDAQKYIAQLKKKDESVIEAYALEGDILFARADYKAAKASYQKSFELAKTSMLVLKIADAEKLAGDEAGSLATLKNWLKENPDDQSVNLYLASKYQQDANNSGAIEHYERILSKNPGNIVAMNNLAWLYIDSDPQRALELAQGAHNLQPQSPAIMDTLGWILVTQDKLEEGLAYLQPARKNAPQVPAIRYHYAKALSLAGESERALEEVSELLDNFEAFEEREDAEKLLAELK